MNGCFCYFPLASSSNWSPQIAKRNEINRFSKENNTKQTDVNHGRTEGLTSIRNSTKRINVFEPESSEKDYTLLDLNSMKYEESLFGDSHVGQAMRMSDASSDEGNTKEKIGAKPAANIFFASKNGTPKAAMKPTATALITQKIIEGQVDFKPTVKSYITPYAIIEQTQSVIITESFFQPTATSKFVNKDEKAFAIEEIFRKLAELASNSRNNTEVSSNNATENKYDNVNTLQNLHNHSSDTNKFLKSHNKHHLLRLKHKVAQPLKLKGRFHNRKASLSKHESQFETVNYDNGLIGILSKHKTKHMYPENIKFELDSNSDGNGKEHSTVIQPSHAIIVLTDDDIGTKKSKLSRSSSVMETGTVPNYSNIPSKPRDKGKYGEGETTEDMLKLNNGRGKREGEYCK